MDERRQPRGDALDEGELLAAYLAAETDEVTTARLTRRLQTDPQLAARLDAIARARSRLQRLDEVVAPDGFRERLNARLAAEGTQAQPAPASASVAARRSRSTRFAMAAAIALMAVLGTASLGVLLLGRAGGGDSASSGGAESAAVQESGPAAAPQADAAQEPVGEEGGGGGEAQERASEAAAGGTAAEAEPLAAAPDVATDAEIVARIREALRDPIAEPARRERELRQAAGLSTTRLCAPDLDATAVDVVRQDGDVVITALATDRQPPQIVVLDPETCTQMRVLEAAP